MGGALSEGYYCINDIDSALVASVTVRIEQQIIMLDFCFVSDPPKPVKATNFNCIIYDWDRSMVCTWDLGVEYNNINNINTTLFMYVYLDETPWLMESCKQFDLHISFPLSRHHWSIGDERPTFIPLKITPLLLKIEISSIYKISILIAELQQSCSRLMFWLKAGGRMLAYLR